MPVAPGAGRHLGDPTKRDRRSPKSATTPASITRGMGDRSRPGCDSQTRSAARMQSGRPEGLQPPAPGVALRRPHVGFRRPHQHDAATGPRRHDRGRPGVGPPGRATALLVRRHGPPVRRDRRADARPLVLRAGKPAPILPRRLLLECLSGVCTSGAFYIEYSYPKHIPPSARRIDAASVVDWLKRRGGVGPRARLLAAVNTPVEYAYVTYDHRRKAALAHLQKYFLPHATYSIGRYGSWKYSSMEDAMDQRKRTAEMLNGHERPVQNKVKTVFSTFFLLPADSAVYYTWE